MFRNVVFDSQPDRLRVLCWWFTGQGTVARFKTSNRISVNSILRKSVSEHVRPLATQSIH